MSVSNAPLIKSITDIKYCLYINLTTRPDRKIHIEGQLRGIGLNPTRFNAIKLKNGRMIKRTQLKDAHFLGSTLTENCSKGRERRIDVKLGS